MSESRDLNDSTIPLTNSDGLRHPEPPVVDLAGTEKAQSPAGQQESSVGNRPRKKRKDELEVIIAPGLGSTSDIALEPPR
jgi:hypothetical protein